MTLVEMLVVLAIIAVTASITVLAMGGGNGGRSGQAEAKRLEARLQLAADRTMLDDEAIALVTQPNGYRFVQWDAGSSQWQDTAVAMLNEPHVLPSGMTLASPEAGRTLQLGADSGGQPFALSLNSEGQTWVVEFDGMTARTLGNGRASAVTDS